MSFVYSGCFQEVLKDQLNQTRMMLGLQEEAFRYPLEKNEMFKAPEVNLILFFTRNEPIISESASVYQTAHLQGKI